MNKTSIKKFATLRNCFCAISTLVISQSPMFGAPAADGNYWVNSQSGVSSTINQISVVSEDFVVASGGSSGTLLLFTDGAWNPFPGWAEYKAANTPFGAWSNTTEMYVAAVTATDIWIGSNANQGNNLRWNGSTFSTNGRGSSRRVRAMGSFARTEGSVVMFGLTNPGGSSPATTIQRIRDNYNLSTPTVTSSMTNVHDGSGSASITGVSGYSQENMAAVAGDYMYRSVDGGNSYTEYLRPEFATGAMRATYTFDNISILTGTVDGNLLQWNAVDGFGTDSIWDFGFTINSIYALDLQNIWVAGNGGNLWFYDGVTATKIDLGITENLNSISGTGLDNIWVAGGDGVIWHTVPEPTTLTLCLFFLAGIAFYNRRRSKANC